MDVVTPIVMILAMFLAFSVIGLIVFVLIKMSLNNSRKVRESWAAAAHQLGADFVPGSWSKPGLIHGTFRNYRIEVTTITRGSGKNQKTYTRVKTFTNPHLALGIRVYREGFFSGVGKVLGFQDIQVGDKGFDDRFIIKGRDEEAVLRLLHSELRHRLSQYDAAVGGKGLELADDALNWESRGVIKDTERLVWLVKCQTDLVRRVCTRHLEVVSGVDNAQAYQFVQAEAEKW